MPVIHRKGEPVRDSSGFTQLGEVWRVKLFYKDIVNYLNYTYPNCVGKPENVLNAYFAVTICLWPGN